jgi:hypothetical protein
MNDKPEDALLAQYQRYNAMRAQAAADVQAAMASGDYESQSDATDRLLACDQGLAGLNNYANMLMRQQQTIPADFAGSDLKSHQIVLAQKTGLNAAQMGAALSATADPRISDEEKAYAYRRNLDRLNGLRAAGYRDEADYQGKR